MSELKLAEDNPFEQKPSTVPAITVPMWKSHSAHYKEALIYMRQRQKGKVLSYKTPWKKINDAAIDGFEFHSITIIAARPGGGKTLIKDQIVREGFDLNPGMNIRVLEFSLEMVGRNSKLREFSSVTKKTYKHLCSAEKEGEVITDELINICKQYAAKNAKYPIDIIDTPLTVQEFKQQIIQYCMDHSIVSDDIRLFCNHVVTLDHSVLLRKVKGQSTIDMLNELGEVCTELKKMFPIAFIILSQLNRDVNNPVRSENGKIGNYIQEGDIFGADALLQHADLLIALDRPALRHITVYGPDRYIIEDDSVLIAHVLKTRTGDTRMSFFKAEFHHMQIAEMDTPEKEGLKTK